jgi:hypothetical protein
VGGAVLDDISARCSISPRVSWVPTAGATAALLGVDVVLVTVSISSSGNCDSVTTSAVISLVIDAMGSTACGILAEQDLVGVLVDDQRDAGLQVQRIVGGMQADELPLRRPRRHHGLAHSLRAAHLRRHRPRRP